ncbi:cation transporter [Rhodocytophaga aerolata]|uniref:Cation transporter n=1 Tax=Rhodocytophaga aerolata TaxID=455078 RepID=A0ABT8RCM6_9BACT|nr:cation transporter [Rhodocytophaga aerolata]MDO1449856.1 cation transporter [Rhodocytophaga aerolata]
MRGSLPSQPAGHTLELSQKEEKALYRKVFRLSMITFLYKLTEGIVSVYIAGDTNHLVLFGFGIHSGIGILTALGIGYMALCQEKGLHQQANYFLYCMLRTAGIGFYFVSARLLTSIIWYNSSNQKPETTIPGIYISIVSAAIVFFLYRYKASLGYRLSSQFLLNDAYATRGSIQMSGVLLFSSILYAFYTHDFIDVIGRAGLTFFTIMEGNNYMRQSRELVQ